MYIVNLLTAISLKSVSALWNFYCSPKTSLCFPFRDLSINNNCFLKLFYVLVFYYVNNCSYVDTKFKVLYPFFIFYFLPFTPNLKYSDCLTENKIMSNIQKLAIFSLQSHILPFLPRASYTSSISMAAFPLTHNGMNYSPSRLKQCVTSHMNYLFFCD